MTFRPLILIALLALLGAAAQAEEILVFRADYENGEVSSGAPGLEAAAPAARDALAVDCSVARSGKCSVVTRLRMDPSYISADAHRSESSTEKATQTLYSPGERFRYKFSLRIDEQWPVDARSAIDVVWQFKRFGTAPDMMVAIKGDTLVWRITQAQQITLTNGLPRGEWVDFDFTVRWSSGADGRAELVMTRPSKGRQVQFSHEGANLRDGRPRSGYLKWGLYKPGQKERQDPFPLEMVHHDDIEVYRLP